MSNDTQTLTLTDFLLARIAEDEASIEDMVRYGDHGWWGDERMFAECDAKRRIVGERLFRDSDPDYELTILGARILTALALPYADHPDYRDEWRP